MANDPIQLTKGARINLTKSAPSLQHVQIGLRWGKNQYDTGADFDLDASVFMCKYDESGSPKLVDNSHLIFYNQKDDPAHSVHHHGDNLTGGSGGDGTDDELIDVNLLAIPTGVEELSIVVTIFEADARKQNFGQAPHSRVQLRNKDTGDVVAEYVLEDDFSTETAVQVGSLYRKDGSWVFKAVGAGFNKGLGDFVLAYGGTVA